jgi:hypothetical protein
MLDIEIDVDRRRVVGRPRVGDRSFHSLVRGFVEIVNLRPGGALRGKRRIIG